VHCTSNLGYHLVITSVSASISCGSGSRVSNICGFGPWARYSRKFCVFTLKEPKMNSGSELKCRSGSSPMDSKMRIQIRNPGDYQSYVRGAGAQIFLFVRLLNYLRRIWLNISFCRCIDKPIDLSLFVSRNPRLWILFAKTKWNIFSFSHSWLPTVT